MQTITGTTQLLGVIGYPVKHSLSPVMHNAAIAQMGEDFVYLPCPIAPKDLPTAIAGLAAIGMGGFSITIPHKQAIIPLLSEISPVAEAVGAVNTVWRTPTGWAGTNTDVEGFLAPLQVSDRLWNQTSAVILGAGGAARAVVAGCAQLGCAKISVVGRNWEKLQAFKASWQHSPLPVNLSVHEWQELPQLIPQAGLLVNSTPVGMSPDVNRSPVTGDILATLPKGAIAYDLIYTPNPTEFLRQAQEVGAEAIDGLEMLVQQGAAALKIWVDRPVPVDVMRQALHQYLGV